MTEINEKILSNEDNNLVEKIERKFSSGFIISLVISIVAIALISLILLMIPNLDVSTVTSPNHIDFNNFFFKWNYIYRSESSIYILENYSLAAGFYLFIPIVSVLLFVTNSAILIKNTKEQRISILMNFILGLIPIILMGKKLRFFTSDVFELTLLVFVFGLFTIYFVPLQILILINKNNFLEWSLLRIIKRDKENSFYLIEIINFLFGTITLVLITAVPFFFFLDHSQFHIDVIEIIVYPFPIHTLFFIFAWIGFNITTIHWINFGRKTAFIISFFTPFIFLISLTYLFFVGFFQLYQSFNLSLCHYTGLTDVIISYTYFISLFFLTSIPIGFFSQKRDHLIIASFYVVFWSIMLTLGWISNPQHIINRFSFKLRLEVSLQIPLVILVIIIGTLWGRFLQNRIKSVSKIVT